MAVVVALMELSRRRVLSHPQPSLASVRRGDHRASAEGYLCALGVRHVLADILCPGRASLSPTENGCGRASRVAPGRLSSTENRGDGTCGTLCLGVAQRTSGNPCRSHICRRPRTPRCRKGEIKAPPAAERYLSADGDGCAPTVQWRPTILPGYCDQPSCSTSYIDLSRAELSPQPVNVVSPSP